MSQLIERRLNETELESLRNRVPGDLALEMLGLLAEKNLMIWCSHYGKDTGFISLDDAEPTKELNAIKQLKSRAGLIALLKREYLVQVKNYEALNTLNEINEKLKKVTYKDPSDYGRTRYGTLGRTEEKRNAPWNSRSEIFTISDEGRKALIGFNTKLNKLRAQEKSLVENPRYVISVRLNNDMQSIGGVGKIYRIVKESAGRAYIKNVSAEEGFPEMPWRDNACQTEGSQYRQDEDTVKYLERSHIAFMDASAQQFIMLRQATLEFDQSVDTALEIKQQKIAPIEREFTNIRIAEWKKLHELIDDQKQLRKETSKAVDLSVEEGFVLSLDEEDIGFKP